MAGRGGSAPRWSCSSGLWIDPSLIIIIVVAVVVVVVVVVVGGTGSAAGWDRLVLRQSTGA